MDTAQLAQFDIFGWLYVEILPTTIHRLIYRSGGNSNYDLNIYYLHD